MTDLIAPSLGGLTPRRMPEAYIRAEVASFPLASIDAFKKVIVSLSPMLACDQDGNEDPTACLWRKCEKHLSQHASGWSLDRLVAIRDFFWFQSEPDYKFELHAKPVPLHRYLSKLAAHYLKKRKTVTDVVAMKGADPYDVLTHYRWLTFDLPEDLLMAALGMYPPPARVAIEPPLMVQRLFDMGVAEVHQHLGAGLDFPTLWASLLALLATPTLKDTGIKGPGLPFGSSKNTFRCFLAAAIARSVLAEFFLWRIERGGSHFGIFLCRLRDRLVGNSDFAASGPPLRQNAGSLSGALSWSTIKSVLNALVNSETLTLLVEGKDEAKLADFEQLHSVYQEIHPWHLPNENGPLARWSEVWERFDPISVRLGFRNSGEGEAWFLQEGIRYLERIERQRSGDDEKLDPPRKGKENQELEDELRDPAAWFTALFWQVIRVRCLFYQMIVQRPMTAGLQWFIRFYDRLNTELLEDAAIEIAYSIAGGAENRFIAAMEQRVRPKENPFKLAEQLRAMTESWKNVLESVSRQARGAEPEFGIVLHLIKSRSPKGEWKEGYPKGHGIGLYGEPIPQEGEIRFGGRYSDYFDEQSKPMEAVAELLDSVPISLWILRGFDITSDELAIPTWIMVPFYRYIEQKSSEAATKCHPSYRPEPMRLTAHVGEDFRHLMEGLRHIFESIQYLLKRTGGRLGHATALGVEPRLWAEETGSVMMPKEERLWDLVFEWRLYSRFEIPDELMAFGQPGRIEWLENNIRRFGTEIFGEIRGVSIDPWNLAMAQHKLHNLWGKPEADVDITLGLNGYIKQVERLSRKYRCKDEEFKEREANKILYQYLRKEAVYRRGQQLVDILLDESEISAIQAVQEALRRAISMRGIVVEINPSSNLLIGNLLDLRNHPVLRLFPPERKAGDPAPVRIALGSDDPITFSTHLIREYSLMHEAALGAGYSASSIASWLEEIQKTSMDARFTLPWMPNGREMADRLIEEFDEYLMKPKQRGERLRKIEHE